MFRLDSVVLAVVATFALGCTRATFGFRPSLTTQVPDSTIVRLRAHDGQPAVSGRALGWQVGRLRIVTSTRDTIAVPASGTLEVRLAEKKTHATLGAVIGFAVALGVKLADCPPPNECGASITPAVSAGVGALIGSRFKAFEWVRVRRVPADTVVMPREGQRR